MRAACRRDALSSTSFARRNSSHISAGHREEIRKYITRARVVTHLRVRNRNRARTGFLLHHGAQGSFPSSRVMFIARRSSWCVIRICSRPRAPPRDLRRDRRIFQPDGEAQEIVRSGRPFPLQRPPVFRQALHPAQRRRGRTRCASRVRNVRICMPLPRANRLASRRTSGNPSPSSRSSLRPRTRSFAVDSPPARARRRVPGVDRPIADTSRTTPILSLEPPARLATRLPFAAEREARIRRQRSHASKGPNTAPLIARARRTASHRSSSAAATIAPATTSEWPLRYFLWANVIVPPSPLSRRETEGGEDGGVDAQRRVLGFGDGGGVAEIGDFPRRIGGGLDPYEGALAVVAR